MDRSLARAFIASMIVFATIWPMVSFAQGRAFGNERLGVQGAPIVIVPDSVLYGLTASQRQEAGWDGAGPMARQTVRPAPLQVDRLGAIETGPIGLEDGYGPAVWRGSRLTYVIPQLSRLPQNPSSYVLRQMELAILRGRAPEPKGAAPSGTSWFEARLKRLYELGDLQSVMQFMALTGAQERDGAIAKINILALLDSGDILSSCLIPMSGRFAKTDLFFTQHKILCALNRGDRAEASLTIELNREMLSQDPFFEALSFMMALDAPETPPASPALIDSLDYALIKIANVPMGNRIQAHRVSRYFQLANDYDVDATLQLEAVKRALELGLMKPKAIREVARLVPVNSRGVEAEPVILSDDGDAKPMPEVAPLTVDTELEGEVEVLSPEAQMVFGGDDLIGLIKNYQLILSSAYSLTQDDVEAFLFSGLRSDSWQLAVTLLAPRIIVLAESPDVTPSDALALAALTLGRIDLAEVFLPPRGQRPNVQPTHNNIYDVIDFEAGRLDVFPDSVPEQARGQLLAVEPTLIERLLRSLAEPKIILDDVSLSNDMVARALRLSNEGRLGDLILHFQEVVGSKPITSWSSNEVVMVVASLAYLGLNEEAKLIADEVVLHLAIAAQLTELASSKPPFSFSKPEKDLSEAPLAEYSPVELIIE